MLCPNDVRELLEAMCSRLGVCLCSDDVERLAADPGGSVAELVDAIVRAEWENAGLENDLRREMEAMVSAAVSRANAGATRAAGA